MFTDISTYDKRIAGLKAVNGYDTNKALQKKVEELSIEKANLCMQAITEAGECFDSGAIDAKYYDETTEKFLGLYDESLRSGVSWYQESVMASLLNTAVSELAQLSLMGTKMVSGLMLTKTGKKYVRERLSKYTMLNEDAIDARRFKAVTFTLEEAGDKYNIHFNYADKWENHGLQTYCKVYFYDDKPVMTIAYNRDKMDHLINSKMNVETKMLQSSLRKHEDYYTAYMCAELQLMHPAIKRTLDTLKSQWKTATKMIDKRVKDEINESVIDDEIDHKIKYVTEACESKFLGKDACDRYIKYLESLR